MNNYIDTMEKYSPSEGEKTRIDNNNVVLEVAEIPQKTTTLPEGEEYNGQYVQYLAPQEVIVNRYIFKK